ncbi:MAG: hypothetical protein ACOCZG_02805 [Halothece sp.]
MLIINLIAPPSPFQQQRSRLLPDEFLTTRGSVASRSKLTTP